MPEEEVPDTHHLGEEEKARLWTRIYHATDGGISTLRENAEAIIASINNLVTYMEKNGSSPTTISGHKFKLIKLYRWLKLPVSDEDLREAVRKVDSVNVTDDRHLTREQVRDILKLHSSPRQKALVSFMVCTGARIGETVQVRLRDIDFTKTPAVVYFPARKTKTKRKRFAFLSSECVEFLRTHIAKRDTKRRSEWLFEGWIPNKKGRNTFPDRHAHPSAAYLQLRDVFAMAGLVPPTPKKNGTSKETAGSNKGAHLEYHPHILRGTCIEFTKTCGYPPDWAEWLVGHDLKTQESYLPSEEKMAEEWLRKCEPSFCFLTNTEINQAQEEQLKAKIAKDTYKTLIEAGVLKPETLTTTILEVIAKKLGIRFDTLVLGGTMLAQDYETFHKFEPGEYQELLKLPLEERRKRYMELRPKLKPELKTQLRLQLFDLIADSVDLDSDIHRKYTEALKVLREDNVSQLSWDNHTETFLRAEIGSDSYMQALADGFRVVDSEGKMRVMSKPKTVVPSLTTEETSQKTGVHA